MTVFRSFIAINLPEPVRERLGQVIGQLRQDLPNAPVRWVPPENIHLTLKFLGDVSVANVEMLNRILETITSGFQSFEFSVGGLDAFPSARRPRVVWVGVQAPQDLLTMQRSIDTETARMGYQSDSRAYTPHLTLGRVARNANNREVKVLSSVLEQTDVGFLGVARVEQVHLYKSELQPGGAVYTKIYSADLKN